VNVDMGKPSRPTRCVAPFAAALATIAFSAATAPPFAGAEVPSLDAYGGQALVLGAPHHRHPGGGSGSASSGDSASKGIHARDFAARGALPGSPSGGRSSAEASREATAQGGGAHSGGSANGQGDANSSADGGRGEPAGPAQAPYTGRQAAQVSAFSTTDVVLLIVGLACLMLLGLALRSARSRTGERSTGKPV
jgi:hypothetical protein